MSDKYSKLERCGNCAYFMGNRNLSYDGSVNLSHGDCMHDHDFAPKNSNGFGFPCRFYERCGEFIRIINEAERKIAEKERAKAEDERQRLIRENERLQQENARLSSTPSSGSGIGTPASPSYGFHNYAGGGASYKPIDPIEEYLNKRPLPKMLSFQEWLQKKNGLSKPQMPKYYYGIIAGVVLLLLSLIGLWLTFPPALCIPVLVIGVAISIVCIIMILVWLRRINLQNQQGYSSFVRQYNKIKSEIDK